MSKYLLKIILGLTLLSICISACVHEEAGLPPIQMSETASPQISSPTKNEVNVMSSTKEETSTSTQSDQVSARFTIQADQDLKQSVSLLYESFYAQESPTFVETGGDLLVTHTVKEEDIHASVEATFLPDSKLIPLSDDPELDDFIAFAISIEGQQSLVDAGELPERITLTDQAGNVLEIKQPVHRVISAHGPTTAIVYSVGVEDRLVAASYLGAKDPLGSAVMAKMDSRFPGILGDDYFSQDRCNIEEAAVLEPELILASARSAWIDTVSELEIPVFLFEAETPERLREAVLLMGQLFGPQSSVQAQVWVDYYDSTLEIIQNAISKIPMEERPRVLFSGTEPLRVASGDMYQTDLIEAAGGFSVSSELGGYWNNVNLEQIVLWQPDVILVPPYGGASVEAITTNPEWQILEAVQEGRVYRLPKLVAPWDTPAPDSVLGIIWLAERLYPREAPLHCAQQAAYFYNTFYNYAITSDEIDTICSFE
ncbi:MAG: ABC transporter substrate-binding protein [Anaerolineales bacterium]